MSPEARFNVGMRPKVPFGPKRRIWEGQAVITETFESPAPVPTPPPIAAPLAAPTISPAPPAPAPVNSSPSAHNRHLHFT